MMDRKIRVLVVDDSAMIRNILADGLQKDPTIEVVGKAADPYMARDKIVELKPDVITLDVEMPRMDGLEFLKKLMAQYPLPVIMVSALTERGKKITLEALEAGAVDFVTKPKADVARGLDEMMIELRTKVKLAASANVSHFKVARSETLKTLSAPRALAETTDKIIVIGASAGGTEAIKEVITRLPSVSPGVVIVQHMPEGFTKLFAERLNNLSQMFVKEATDGDRVMPGVVLVAPGSYQMSVIRSGGFYRVKCEKGEKVCGHCPSVEVLMRSAAACAGANAVGVMLTGMGSDGAGGMKAMRDAGARTIAQSEESCVVFGMPKSAINAGGVEFIVSLNDIAGKVLSLFS
ncbi:MAG TPA: chemotaxis response regulator protein-glutamate methylesterase [Candidatus Rifleibacterium sp.]|nr:chemotaxis response regulator protein-glutamate methylesterase [Candidatus Ozemobacteraceae bacterium]HNW09723.1 chemotaxis response regulator protein-glutamate methylesterase [Candidatus Rifleibacterium sp.]HPW57035.1 chemotaxis response regulator protein-glutamate methylesterase [Candidatus Rifleibacterium sp.]